MNDSSLSSKLSASLPGSVGVSYLPPMTAALLRAYSRLSLASLQAFPVHCIETALPVARADLVLLLQIASSAPLLLLSLLLAVYLLQTELAHWKGLRGRDYRDHVRRAALRYATLAWMIVAVTLGGVGQLALKCFFCVDIDPDRIFSSSATLTLWFVANC